MRGLRTTGRQNLLVMRTIRIPDHGSRRPTGL